MNPMSPDALRAGAGPVISEEDEARYLAMEGTPETYESYCWTVLRLAAYLEHVLEDFDLTRRQHSMMCVLVRAPMSLTALARRSNVTPPSATIMVRGLLKKGVVTRSLSPTDQRRVWIGLSEEGRRVLQEIDERAKDRLVEIASYFSEPADAERELAAIGNWAGALNRFRGDWLRRTGRG